MCVLAVKIAGDRHDVWNFTGVAVAQEVGRSCPQTRIVGGSIPASSSLPVEVSLDKILNPIVLLEYK